MARGNRTAPNADAFFLRRRMALAAGENVTRRGNAAVDRVLNLLADENLLALAAQATSINRITVECGVIGQVWGHPRIFNRRNQLSRQGIDIERETIVSYHGGREFSREVLVISF
jgi:hypothetical protein